MGLVKRIEHKLEAAVGDAFARVFGGSIVPAEVESALQTQATDGVRTLDREHRLAPNEYVVVLSATDHAKVLADDGITPDTFARHLDGYIHDQGWQTYGEVVVRFEQSAGLHTGQFRARAVVNPDASPGPPAAPPRNAPHVEPGVARMTDNPSYRGPQGQGRPADDHYDDRYGRGQDDQRGGGPEARGGYPDQGGYPPQGDPNYPPRQQGGGYDQGGYPDQGGYQPSYDQQRPPAGYGPPPGGGYDQGYRQGPPPGGGYAQPGGGQPGGGQPGGQQGYGDYDYGRGPAPRPDEGYGRPGYGGDYQQQGYPNQGYGRPDYAQPDRYDQPGGRYDQPAASGYDQGGYDQGGYGGGYDQGGYDQGGGYEQAGYGGYDQGGYGGAGAVTLQLDDGSGRTYQLRDGANIVGRGQDAQFRLPDTGVSRRHLEIRWDGQVALLVDLNSTNGTTVNNAPVQEWQLADGDVVRLGHSEIIVRIQ